MLWICNVAYTRGGVESFSERTSFLPQRWKSFFSFFFRFKGWTTLSTFLDSTLPPNNVMKALLCVPPICPGFQTEKVQKCLKTCPQQGNCEINKLFSWNSQGTEGMNTLMKKKAQKTSFSQSLRIHSKIENSCLWMSMDAFIHKRCMYSSRLGPSLLPVS